MDKYFRNTILWQMILCWALRAWQGTQFCSKGFKRKRSRYSQEWNLASWPCIGIGPVWIIIGLDSSGRDFPKCWRFTLWRSNRESFAAFYVTNSSLRSPSFDIWGTYGMLAIVLAVSQLGLRTFSRERFRGRAYLGKSMIKFSSFLKNEMVHIYVCSLIRCLISNWFKSTDLSFCQNQGSSVWIAMLALMYLDKGIVIHINLCIYWETIIHIIHIITYWIAMLTLMNLDKTSFSVWQTSSIKSQFHTIPFKEFHFAYFWRSSSICLRGGRSPCTTSITLCKERLNHLKVFFSPPMSARIKNQFGTFPRPDQSIKIWRRKGFCALQKIPSTHRHRAYNRYSNLQW